MSSSKKFSIITVTYNCKDVLESTILSIINQDYDNYEFLVIDGGSTDGTVDIIKKYQDSITYWVSERDKGIYDAMNKGISKASGYWINFMNAGDTFFNNKVLSTIAPMIEDDATIVYGQLMKVYNRFMFISDPEPVNLDGMNGSVRLPHQAMFSKTSYQKNRPFDTNLRSAADFKFYHDAHFVDKCKFQYLPVVIAYYDAETGMSKDSHIGPLESLRIQGHSVSDTQKAIIKFKCRCNNFFKKYLPESIITKLRKRKFTKRGLVILERD